MTWRLPRAGGTILLCGTSCSALYLPLQVKVLLLIAGNVNLSVKVFQLFGLLIIGLTWCLGDEGFSVFFSVFSLFFLGKSSQVPHH